MLPRSSQLNRTLHLANRTLEDNISMSWTQLGPDGLFIPQQMTGAVSCFGTSAISHLYRTGRSSAASGVNAWSHDAPSRTVCKSIAITATASGWPLPPTTEQQYQYQLRNICKIRSSMIMKSFMLSSRHVYYTFFSLNSQVQEGKANPRGPGMWLHRWPMTFRYNVIILSITFKAHRNLVPYYIKDFLTLYIPADWKVPLNRLIIKEWLIWRAWKVLIKSCQVFVTRMSNIFLY